MPVEHLTEVPIEDFLEVQDALLYGIEQQANAQAAALAPLLSQFAESLLKALRSAR